MKPTYYVSETLDIERFRLLQEQRIETHYNKSNENAQVIKDRYERIKSLEASARFLEYLNKQGVDIEKLNSVDINSNVDLDIVLRNHLLHKKSDN